MAGAPEQPRRLVAHHLPDRAAEALALRIVKHRELVQIGVAVLIGQHYRRAVIFADIRTHQLGALEVVGREAATERRLDQGAQPGLVQRLPAIGLQYTLTTPHQGARALVGEQFLGQLRGLGDGHRGGRRQLVEEILDLLDLDPHAAVDPRLVHQVLVFGGQVDGVDDPAVVIQQAAGTGQENDLVGLQDLHQFAGGKVRVDVQDLPTGGLTQTGDHRNRPRLQAGLDRREFDLGHLPHQTERFAVEVVGFKHAGDDRGRPCTAALQRLHQPQILRVEHPPHDRQPLRGGHPQPVDGLLHDAGTRQLIVQLGTRAVQHDRGQADVLQERERGRQRIQIVAQDRATDLDHRKPRRVELREALQVLADFLGAGHAGQQPHDGLAGLDIVVGRSNGHGVWLS